MSRPIVALTFDDGYREHLNVVAPMLAERTMTATFDVATGLNGTGRAVAAVDAWYWLLDHAKGDRACIPLADGRAHSGRFDTLDGKSAWVTGELKAAFLAADPARQRQMLEALAEGARCELPSDLAGQLYMGPEEWLELVRRGIALELDEEVAGSVAAISAICSPVAFAYPDGAFDERVAERVWRSGASSAVTCIPGDVARNTDAMRLPRRFIATPVHQG